MIEQKYDQLLQYIRKYKKAAIAFSGGVDSTFLLYAAREALGDQVLALTADSCFIPRREIQEAKEFCENWNVEHQVCKMDILKADQVADNPADRCYICKKSIFSEFIRTAQEEGCDILMEGSNEDDKGDYRPGARAIKELKVVSPLQECALTKEEIRILSKKRNVPTWSKPSFACLASRIPYGERITEEKLGMVEQGEQLLMDLGFEQFRVRVHGQIARIEVLPEDLETIVKKDIRERIYQEFKRIGFQYAALDLCGYRTGSLNEMLQKEKETLK